MDAKEAARTAQQSHGENIRMSLEKCFGQIETYAKSGNSEAPFWGYQSHYEKHIIDALIKRGFTVRVVPEESSPWNGHLVISWKMVV